MKKKNLAAGILLAGTAAALTGAGAVLHNIIVRKRPDPTDLIVSPDTVNGEERKKLWTESNRWLNERGSEKVSIQSFDGLTLRGEFFEGEGEPDSTVFLVHGYRCNRRREYAVIARFYLEAGYNVLLADDRAHGESDGRYIGFGILDREDCYRWVRFLDERFHGKQKIFLHGISMGAAAVLMASNLCLPMSVRGIVEDCGFTSPEEEFRHVLKQSGKGFLSRPLIFLTNLFCRACAGYGFSDLSSADCIAESRLPVLVIHGEKDDFVPTVMGRKIYQAAAGEKEIWITKGAGHAESYYLHKEEYEQKVLGFFHRCIEADAYAED